ncbi:MAG: methylated-DNA--[protein]-cysteine S-methyltransferase [Bergeyella sp.]|nr:methylated-DNA--[protein]-cysteine S-methyltransferase [Bergeyella sp.]
MINIFSQRIQTPLGEMKVCGTEEKICLLWFIDKKGLPSDLAILEHTFSCKIIHKEFPLFKELRSQLSEYFEGKRKEFSIPVFCIGSDFQKNVWGTLAKIPYGSTVSYKDQARALNRPSAVRAVANADGANKISILIPCHRVLGSDGSLKGYAGGVWRKEKLLTLESKF